MKKMKHLGIIMLVIATFLTSCNSKKQEQTTTVVDEVLTIKVDSVKIQDVVQEFEYTAVVRPEALNNIAPTTPGRIEQIFVEVGQRVSKGQKLIQMDATMLRQAKTQLNNLEKNFERFEELFKVGGISKAEYDAQKTQLEVSRNNIKNLEENTQLHSPISGVVTMRNYDSGDIYAGTPILQIQQITPVKLLINISESQYQSIKLGMKAKVLIDIFKGEEFNGKVTLIHPTLDPRTHTFTVEVTLPNANTKVRPGMYGKVVFDFGAVKNVVVPEQAIVKVTGSSDRYVYVLNNDQVKYTKVILGRRLENGYEVLSGLNDGDQVAITSLTKLKNGSKVKIAQ